MLVTSVGYLGSLGVAARLHSTPTTTAKVGGSGLSLAYPRTWIVVAIDKRKLAAQVTALAKNNPRAAQALATNGQDVLPSTHKFSATDLSTATAFDNVAVRINRHRGFPSSSQHNRGERLHAGNSTFPKTA